MEKPTKAQYESSLHTKSLLAGWIKLSKERQDALLDDLFKERDLEKGYQESYKHHELIIHTYELYEELENK